MSALESYVEKSKERDNKRVLLRQIAYEVKIELWPKDGRSFEETYRLINDDKKTIIISIFSHIDNPAIDDPLIKFYQAVKSMEPKFFDEPLMSDNDKRSLSTSQLKSFCTQAGKNVNDYLGVLHVLCDLREKPWDHLTVSMDGQLEITQLPLIPN
jgi:hypothetical protein